MPAERVRILASDATTPNFTSSVTREASDASAIGILRWPVLYNNRFIRPKEFSHAGSSRIPAAKGGRSSSGIADKAFIYLGGRLSVRADLWTPLEGRQQAR